MGVWGWIVLYVLAFSVVQLLVYRYLRSDEEEETPLFSSTPTTRDRAGGEEIGNAENHAWDDRAQIDDHRRNADRTGDDDRTRDDPPTGGSSTVVCPRCGTENETGYTYCRSCVGPMAVR